MNLKELEQIVLRSSSSLMRIMGEEVYRNGLVSNIRGRKIENMYHIYGDVLNNTTHNKFKTYIKINMLNKKLEDVNCTCNNYKEISLNKRLFMCEHLTATTYKFFDILYRRKDKQKESSENLQIQKKKAEVGIDVKITCKAFKGTVDYELEFRLGIEHKYLITDLKSFIFDLENKKSIYFNNQFTYNPMEHNISHKDIKIIDFIKKYVCQNKGMSITRRNLIVSNNDLRKFLQCVSERKVQFKYNGIEYKTNVLKKDLPLIFTLKDKNNYFALTTHKKLPIPLNSNRDVYFFNNELYLPSTNQIQKYNFLYDKFKKDNEILYNKTIGNYKAIIILLSEISNNITITEEVKRFASNTLIFEFLIYKEEQSIYCDVFAIYYNQKINILEEGSNTTQLMRDFNKEEKVLMKLEYYKFIKRTNRLVFVGGDEELFNMLSKREKVLRSFGTVILGKGMEDIKLCDSSSINIDLFENGEYIGFGYKIGHIKNTELINAYESYKADNNFYKTKDNTFIDFEDQGVRNFFSLFESINKNIEDGSVQIEKGKALYLAEGLKNGDFKFGKGINLLKSIEEKLIHINSKEVDLPKTLKTELRGYQVEGYKWFKNLKQLEFGGILADEMGLGKTVQTIAFLVSEEDKKSLIITPTSLIYNWKDEMERFAPILRVGIAHGEEHERIIDKSEEYDVIITTYGTLRNNIDKYHNLKFDYCIIDEAQNIKNPAAKNTKVVKEIEAKIRFALTGTPIENNLNELWSIFDFVMPGYLYSKETFEKKFISNSEYDFEGLKLLIKPFILRRTKRDVIEDLPDKIEKKILVEMTASQKIVYNSYLKDIRAKIKNNTEGRIEIFSYLTKLRQICLDPSLIFDEYKGGSGKIKVAMALIEDQIESQGKLLLFSQFTSVLNKIRDCLERRGIEYFYLTGATGPKERMELVNKFNSSEEVNVFLISLKAGGTGLNLTSANLVIHFDPWWNPAVEDQAADRAHRIGQENIVEVIKLVARGTIEEKIILLQEHKKEIIDNIITGELKESDMLKKISKDELLQLFHRD